MPKVVRDIQKAMTSEIYNYYLPDLNMARDEFHSEVRRWQTKWAMHADDLPTVIQGTLNAVNRYLYPAIF